MVNMQGFKCREKPEAAGFTRIRARTRQVGRPHFSKACGLGLYGM